MEEFLFVLTKIILLLVYLIITFLLFLYTYLQYSKLKVDFKISKNIFHRQDSRIITNSIIMWREPGQP